MDLTALTRREFSRLLVSGSAGAAFSGMPFHEAEGAEDINISRSVGFLTSNKPVLILVLDYHFKDKNGEPMRNIPVTLFPRFPDIAPSRGVSEFPSPYTLTVAYVPFQDNGKSISTTTDLKGRLALHISPTRLSYRKDDPLGLQYWREIRALEEEKKRRGNLSWNDSRKLNELRERYKARGDHERIPFLEHPDFLDDNYPRSKEDVQKRLKDGYGITGYLEPHLDFFDFLLESMNASPQPYEILLLDIKVGDYPTHRSQAAVSWNLKPALVGYLKKFTTMFGRGLKHETRAVQLYFRDAQTHAPVSNGYAHGMYDNPGRFTLTLLDEPGPGAIQQATDALSKLFKKKELRERAFAFFADEANLQKLVEQFPAAFYFDASRGDVTGKNVVADKHPHLSYDYGNKSLKAEGLREVAIESRVIHDGKAVLNLIGGKRYQIKIIHTEYNYHEAVFTVSESKPEVEFLLQHVQKTDVRNVPYQ